MRPDAKLNPIILRVLTGPEQGRSLEIHSGSTLIGRDTAADFALPADATVSKRHASIAWESGHWTLRDLASKNGTFIESGGTRHALESAQPIIPGTVFWVGSAQIQVDRVPLSDVAPVQERLSIAIQPQSLAFQFETPDAVVARFEQSWRPNALASVLGRLRSVLATAEASGRILGDAPFTEIGESLLRELLPDSVAEILFRRDAPPLSLLLDPALLHIPWELLCQEGRFLCLERPLSRQTIANIDVVKATKPQDSTRLLIIANPDGTLPAAQDEGEALLDTLVEEMGMEDVSFLANRRARKQDVLRQLESASVVYYLGHAEHDASEPRQSAWLLADGRLTAAELGQLAAPPKLVIANACESARESLHLPGTDGLLAPEVAGLGLSLLLAGVSHYVGTLWRVPAVSAAGCGTVLLRELLDGAPIGQALLSTRRAARDEYGNSAMTWAAYAQYGNPLWRLRP